MEEHVQRNLKLYGILEALRAGCLPSNAQLDAILAYVISLTPNPASKKAEMLLSADTLDMLASLRRLVETLRVVLREKNGDELAQDTLRLMFIESLPQIGNHAQPCVNPTHASDGPVCACPKCLAAKKRLHAIDQDLNSQVDKAAGGPPLREGEFAQGARHIRTLATIIATNADLRQTIMSLIDVGRQIIRSKKPKDEDAAEAVTEEAAVKPPADLGSAPEEPQMETAEPEPAPVEPAPSSTAVDEEEDDPPIPGAWGAPWEDDSDSDDDEFEDAEEHPLEDTLRKSPRLRDFIRHVKCAVNTLQSHPGYAESMTWLMDVFQAYESEMIAAKFPDKPAPMSVSKDAGPPSLTATRQILINVITLIQRFARGKSVSPIQRAILKVYEDMIATPELRALWDDIDAFVRCILLQHGYINTPQCAVEARALFARADKWLNNTVYWAHWNALTTALSWFFGTSYFSEDEETDSSGKPKPWFKDDPLTNRLEEDWDSFVSSLFLDARRHMTVKRALWRDVGNMLFPTVRGFGYVTIPRLEFVSPNMELVLENVNVSLANLLPTYFTIEWYDKVKCSPFQEAQQACMTGSYSRARIRATQIQGEVRDAMLALNWKKGVKIKDMALVDIIVSRYGISVDIELEIDTNDSSDYIIRTKKVEFTIDEATVTPKGSLSGRDSLYRVLLATFGVSFLKKRLTTRWAIKVNEKISELNAELMALRARFRELNKAAAKDRRRGIPAPGTTALLLQVIHARLKEWKVEKEAKDAIERKQIRRVRRLSAASMKSEKVASSESTRPTSSRTTSRASSISSATSSSGSQSSLESEPQAEPGGDTPKPFKKFKISARLEDTIFPHISYDKAKSLVWRRKVSEREARRATEAAIAIGTSASSSTVAPTATGLRSGAPKEWRSPVFNIT